MAAHATPPVDRTNAPKKRSVFARVRHPRPRTLSRATYNMWDAADDDERAPPPSPPPHPLASCRCDFCNATLLRSAPLLLLLWVCVICCYSALCAATFFYSCKREAAVAAGSAQRCCCVLFLFSCHAFALGTPCSSRIPDLHRRGGGHFLPLALALLCGCSRCIVSGGRMGALLCLVTFTSLPSPLRPAATQQARVGRAERHRHSLMMMSMGRGLHWQCVCVCVCGASVPERSVVP